MQWHFCGGFRQHFTQSCSGCDALLSDGASQDLAKVLLRWGVAAVHPSMHSSVMLCCPKGRPKLMQRHFRGGVWQQSTQSRIKCDAVLSKGASKCMQRLFGGGFTQQSSSDAPSVMLLLLRGAAKVHTKGSRLQRQPDRNGLCFCYGERLAKGVCKSCIVRYTVPTTTSRHWQKSLDIGKNAGVCRVTSH